MKTNAKSFQDSRGISHANNQMWVFICGGSLAFSGVHSQFLVHKQYKWRQTRLASEGTQLVGSSETVTNSCSKLSKLLFKYVIRLFPPPLLPTDGEWKRKREREGGEEKLKERRVESSQRGNVSPCTFGDFRDSLLDSWDL